MTSACPNYSLRRRRLRIVTVVIAGAVIFLFTTFVREPKLVFDTYGDVMIPLKSNHKNQEEYIDRRGIHVVVGHYLGDDIPGKSEPNLTEEIINSNGYSPQPGAGANGMPVQIPSFEMGKMQLLYNINRFNLLASDRIPLNRTLPDVRKKRCQEKELDMTKLPSTSVIIVFHNEAWSTLLRTVHSVINRSPRSVLKEIILVDDASERDFLKKPLEEEVAKLPVPVKVIRAGNRTGLIRSRLLGAQESKGEVLTFLDAHCEVTKGWLEPLLSRIGEDKTRVVCPIIDIIDESSFQYVRSFELHWGAFNWNLHYRWYSLGRKEMEHRTTDVTDVYKTPAMAGGLFSIDKKFFYSIGSYDKKMDIWGGENLEMSFRVWMCGGSIEIAPCSHVGHIFRKSSPYTFPGDGGVGGILYRNLARVALVWMDDWANFYFKMNPEAEAASRTISVGERRAVREKLNCRSFEWYLNNVWETNFFPGRDKVFGKIRSLGARKCLQRPQYPGGSIYPSGPAALKECVIETYAPQSFVFSNKGYIMTDESVCMDAPDTQHSADPQIRIAPCTETDKQRWTYDEEEKQIIHLLSRLCLDLPSKDNPETLSLRKCDSSSLNQKWIFEHEDWTKVK
ncbi:UNVERIFIED_CONTAM: hypothetical protein RMT77_002573 [Armadillidium vulgare]